MTQIQSISTAPPSPLLTRAIRLCWTSQSAQRESGRRRFFLNIDCESTDEAIVEAWVEEHDARRLLLPRQVMKIETSLDERFIHIDVIGHNGDGRVAAITVLNEAQSGRAIYAQTSLLAKAGFTAGSYDAPVLK